MDVLVEVSEFVLHGVNQDPIFGIIKPTIGVMKYLGCLSRTVVRHDADNYGHNETKLQGSVNNILARGIIRWGSRGFLSCRVSQEAENRSKE